MMAFEGKKAPSFWYTFIDIYNLEKIKGFYKGLQANVMRACVLNGTKMACYDQIKQYIIQLNCIPS